MQPTLSLLRLGGYAASTNKMGIMGIQSWCKGDRADTWMQSGLKAGGFRAALLGMQGSGSSMPCPGALCTLRRRGSLGRCAACLHQLCMYMCICLKYGGCGRCLRTSPSTQHEHSFYVSCHRTPTSAVPLLGGHTFNTHPYSSTCVGCVGTATHPPTTTQDFIPYDELVKLRLEDGIDPTQKQDYLNEEDFEKVRPLCFGVF